MSEKEFVINKLAEGLSAREVLDLTPENLSESRVLYFLRLYPDFTLKKRLGILPKVLLQLFLLPHMVNLMIIYSLFADGYNVSIVIFAFF